MLLKKNNMATNRPFAYNPTHTSVAGTYNIGDLAVGITEQNYNTNPGGLIWWGGPDEEQGYVIAVPVPGNTQPTPLTDNRLYLSSTYKATDIGLSNNKQTATEIFSYQQSVLGETLITTNKVMFSIQFNSTNPSVGIGGRFIGLGKLNMNYEGPFNGYPGNDDKSFGFNDSGQLYNKGLIEDSGFPSWGDGDIIDIAINGDLTTLIWIRVNGGEWNNNSNAHPESDTYGVNFGGYVYISEIYPALCPYIYGSMTIQNYPKYGVPSGYEFLGNTLASVKFLGTKVYPNPLSDSTFIGLAEGYFNQSFTSATEASTWLTNNGYWNSYVENGGNGLTPETAGDNALQIKTDYPSSQDGLYWIKNNNISGGTPFQIYADMTTDGGGWTLLVTNQNTNGWTYSNSILLNEFNPVSGGSNYSIVTYADYLKSSGATFQYMLDAKYRNQFGGIWSAPSGYTFLNTDNTQTSITLDIKFGTWNYNNASIEQHMPWRSTSSGLLTTSENPGGEWWGTIITNGGWAPAPWINGDCGLDGCMPNPSIIWYWVR